MNKQNQTELISIDKIVVPPRRRAIDKAKVKSLVKSLHEIGLLNPISLRTDLTLIAGHHRLAAYNQMGRREIEARVFSLNDLQAELAEIDENLERCPLSDLEFSQYLDRRKTIYEELHPETKRGVAGGKASGQARNGKDRTSDILSFVQDTAKKTGKSTRTIERDLAIARDMDGDVQEIVALTPLARNKSELRKLAKLPKDQQKAVAAKIKAGKAKRGHEAMPWSPKPTNDWNKMVSLSARLITMTVNDELKYLQDRDCHHRLSEAVVSKLQAQCKALANALRRTKLSSTKKE